MKRSNYIVIAKFAVKEVLDLIVIGNTNARKEIKVNENVYNPRVGVPRLMLFKLKGTKCVGCGLEGKEFNLQFDKNLKAKEPHLGLWAWCKKGEARLLTIDHIVPRSKGGANRLYNYQVMCNICNREKGDKYK